MISGRVITCAIDVDDHCFTLIISQLYVVTTFNFDVKRTCTTGKCVGIPHYGGVEKHQGDVERHRVYKHIIRWRSHHPQ